MMPNMYWPIWSILTGSLLLNQCLASSVCYSTGSEIQNPDLFPCNATAEFTSCCTARDYCLSNDLCQPGVYVADLYTKYYFDGCTDPTGQDPSCLNFCPNIGGNGLQPCPRVGPTAYCCFGFTGCNCSDPSQIISIAAGTIIRSPVSSTTLSSSSSTLSTSTSSATSATISASTTVATSSSTSSTASASSDTAKKSNNLPIGLGVGLGVFVAIVGIAVGIWFGRRKRAENQHNRPLLYYHNESPVNDNKQNPASFPRKIEYKTELDGAARPVLPHELDVHN